jgi:hypothetical protein
MSAFTTPADLRMLDDYRWEILSPFEYHIGELGSGNVITVPIHTTTDLVSTPRLLWAIFPPHGKWAKAAIVHDYLYDKAIGTKRWADGIFLEAMTVLGVPPWRKYFAYWAVRLFGRGNYAKINQANLSQ